MRDDGSVIRIWPNSHTERIVTQYGRRTLGYLGSVKHEVPDWEENEIGE